GGTPWDLAQARANDGRRHHSRQRIRPWVDLHGPAAENGSNDQGCRGYATCGATYPTGGCRAGVILDMKISDMSLRRSDPRATRRARVLGGWWCDHTRDRLQNEKLGRDEGRARPKRFELLTPRFVVWCRRGPTQAASVSQQRRSWPVSTKNIRQCGCT